MKYLLIPLMLSHLSACSPSGENLSPLDIQKGPSSLYNVEVNWICADELNKQRSACPQRVLQARAVKVIWYAYTNVGLATIPEGAVRVVVSVDGKVVLYSQNSFTMKPGKIQISRTPPGVFGEEKVAKGPGSYEVMLELGLLEEFEEANTDDNVAVQLVEIRE